MGVFRVQISVGDNERRQWQDLSAVVDTGTFMSAVPGSALRDLGLVPTMNETGNETGTLADGTEKNFDTTYTWLRLNGREVMTCVIFNDEFTDPLLGSLALETLLYVVDPSGERLVPRTRFPF